MIRKLTYGAHYFKLLVLSIACLIAMVSVYGADIHQLQDISITNNKNKITISWSATAQQADVYYEIEKAGQDKVFKTAGILFPRKEDLNKAAYTFKDIIRHTGTDKIIYYRVKQVNANGTANYSPIKAVYLKRNKVINIGETVLVNNGIHRYSYQPLKCLNDYKTNYMMARILRHNFNYLNSYNKTYPLI
ncbi:MAG: hypothetical protein EKK37_14825 [Sphingobacteriales bacterium]|nr:MAG: hypothetical protein EKK37_14825 [Sphingobacteriales bacterium]